VYKYWEWAEQKRAWLVCQIAHCCYKFFCLLSKRRRERDIRRGAEPVPESSDKKEEGEDAIVLLNNE
jgi:hypothetical protein